MAEPDAGHVIPLGGGRFGMWRSAGLRGAGLPYDWLADGAVLRQPLFGEALCWQHARVAAQLRAGPRGNKRDRQLARTLASYRTRYCAKNDSIGYYGPVAWAEWVDDETSIPEFTPPRRGEALLELWAVRAVGDALTERHGLSGDIVPHVAPAVGVAQRDCYLYDGSRLALSDRQRRIVASCDGFRTVADIVAECAAPGDAADAALVARELRRLQAIGVITRGLTLGQSPHPERQLRAQMWRAADPARREAAIRELDELLAARDRVTAAIGDPPAVAGAMEDLDQTFAAITGLAPRRRDGEFYAGRTLVYEECVIQRPTRLSRRLLDDIGPALELVLISARWLSARVAERYQDRVRALMAEDPGRHDDGYPLPLLLSRLEETTVAAAAEPLAELRRRWTGILLGGGGAGIGVRLTAEGIREQVLRAFAAPAPGWPSARWHSPDLMIAANSAADIDAGRHLAVLGEVHVGINSLDQLNFVSGHPDPAGFRRWVDADMPRRIVPVYPSDLVNSRTAPPEAYHSPSYCYLGVGTEPSYAPRRARLIPAGALRVHLEAGRLLVRSAVDDFEADLLEVADDLLGTVVFNRFGFLLRRAHLPRVQVDRLVLSRQSWRLPFAEFAPLDGARLPRVVAEMNRVRQKFRLPSPVFCVVAGETKPVYLDFDDPSVVDMVWHKLRRGRTRAPGGEVVITEMLPGPGELWRQDAEGRRYTSEFRIVCVDAASYQPASRPGCEEERCLTTTGAGTRL
jgi:lantibiotic biosynthesis dehydratase-like protein